MNHCYCCFDCGLYNVPVEGEEPFKCPECKGIIDDLQLPLLDESTGDLDSTESVRESCVERLDALYQSLDGLQITDEPTGDRDSMVAVRESCVDRIDTLHQSLDGLQITDEPTKRRSSRKRMAPEFYAGGRDSFSDLEKAVADGLKSKPIRKKRRPKKKPPTMRRAITSATAITEGGLFPEITTKSPTTCPHCLK